MAGVQTKITHSPNNKAEAPRNLHFIGNILICGHVLYQDQPIYVSSSIEEFNILLQ